LQEGECQFLGVSEKEKDWKRYGKVLFFRLKFDVCAGRKFSDRDVLFLRAKFE
jgi:hypothetical protein